MRYLTGTAARQLELEYLDLGSAPSGGPARTASQAGQRTCAICQTRHVMVVSRRGLRTDLFHTLCFRCYHLQMQRKRMMKRRRAQAVVQGATDDLIGTVQQRPAVPEPKYAALEHRRRQAQMAARRELEQREEGTTGPVRARRIARVAALAGRAG